MVPTELAPSRPRALLHVADLWFIVQNYDHLPWWTYFTHAHEYAWHHNAYSQLASMLIAVEHSGLAFLNTAHDVDG